MSDPPRPPGDQPYLPPAPTHSPAGPPPFGQQPYPQQPYPLQPYPQPPASFGQFQHGQPRPSWWRPTSSAKARAGMVLGLCSILLFFTFVVPLLALIFGLLGAAEVKSSRGEKVGLGQARTGWILGSLGLAAIGAIVIVAIVNRTPGVDEDGNTSVTALEVGTCVNIPDKEAELVFTLPAVPCSLPHDAEVFLNGQLNPDRDRSFPGEDAVSQEAILECIDEPFADYVGADYGDAAVADLDAFALYPQKLTWGVTRGEFTCLVVKVDETKLTGSIAGERG